MSGDNWTAPIDPSAGAVGRADYITYSLQNIQAIFNGLVGDASADALMLHLHKSGTLVNIPTVGNVGREYYATDLGAGMFDDGTLWTPKWHNPRICDRHYTEFQEQDGSTLSADGYICNWRVTMNNWGNATVASGRGHSQLEVQTDTSSGDYAFITPSGNGNTIIDPSNSLPIIWQAAIRFNSNADVSYHAGLIDLLSSAATPAPSTSAMFRIIDGGNFITVTQNDGGGETTNDTGVAPTNSDIDHLMIIVYSSSLCEFYINGVKTDDDHSAGIPQDEHLHQGMAVRTSTTSEKNIRPDMADLLFVRDYS